MKTLKKLFGFSLGPFLGAALSTISVPIATHYLLPNEYGKTSMFNLAYSILSMIIFCGFDQAFIREYFEQKNKRFLLMNAIILPSIFTLILILLTVSFPEKISYFLFEDGRHVGVIYLLAASLPFMMIERFILVDLRMQEKAFKYSFFSLLVRLISFCLTLFFLFFIRKDFLAIVYSVLLAHIIGDSILFFVCRKNFYFKDCKFDIMFIKQMMHYALPLLPTTVIGVIFNGEDKLFIKYFSDYNELGFYQVSMTLANVLVIFQVSFSTFWTPTALRWKNEHVENQKYELVQKSITCIAGVIFISVLMFRNLFPILLSERYSVTKYILPFLLFYPMMSMMTSSTALGIDFARKTKYFLYFSIIVTILNFFLNIIFVPRYGAAGAAIATGLSHVFYFWIRTIFSRKLWFKFELTHLWITTTVLSVVALVNSLSIFADYFVYLIDALALCIELFVYRKLIYSLWLRFRRTR